MLLIAQGCDIMVQSTVTSFLQWTVNMDLNTQDI